MAKSQEEKSTREDPVALEYNDEQHVWLCAWTENNCTVATIQVSTNEIEVITVTITGDPMDLGHPGKTGAF